MYGIPIVEYNKSLCRIRKCIVQIFSHEKYTFQALTSILMTLACQETIVLFRWIKHYNWDCVCARRSKSVWQNWTRQFSALSLHNLRLVIEHQSPPVILWFIGYSMPSHLIFTATLWVLTSGSLWYRFFRFVFHKEKYLG